MEKHTILVVEDDPNILLELKKTLVDEGYQVDTADNGKDALKLWKQNIYDLVLADLRIPSVDGIVVIDKIKTNQPHTQVIILSGQGNEEDLIVAINKHVFKFLKKPADMADVLNVIGEALRERDPVIMSLERVVEKSPDVPILLVGRKSFTPRQLYDEVRKGTAAGNKFHEEYLKTLTDFEPAVESVDQLLGMNGVAE